MDFEDRSGTGQAGGITGKRDIIVAPNMLRWVAEGKVFSAGVGYENGGIDSDGNTLDDESPEAALVASNSSDIFVLPLLVRMSTHTEGGAAPRMQVAITRAAADCAVTLVVSGTAMPAIHNHNSSNNNSPTAAATYTCTSTALTNLDYVMLVKAQAADNPVSGTGGLGFNNGTVFELDMLKDPHLLSQGAALLIYPNTNTSDASYCPYIVWAELTEDDLY